MILDLSSTAESPPETAIPLNAIARESRREFTELIGSLSHGQGSVLDFLLTPLGSRNTYASPFFSRVCGLLLVKRLVESGEDIERVVTDSSAQARILEQWAASAKVPLSVEVRGAEGRIRRMARAAGRVVGHLARQTAFHLMARRTRPATRDNFPHPLTLIFTFAGRDFDETRYYPGLLEELPPEEKERIRFVPAPYQVPIRAYGNFIQGLRGTRRYLIKDDILHLTDVLYAWFHWLRILMYRPGRAEYHGFDLWPLAAEEISSMRGLGSAMTGLLCKRFAERLVQAGIKVRRTIDWFENQEINKGWNAGFGSAFPDAVKVGYQGYVAGDMELCTKPAVFEAEAGVLPDLVVVTGPKLAEPARAFASTLKVHDGPALRYVQLYAPPSHGVGKRENAALAAFPLSEADGTEVCRQVVEALGLMPGGMRIVAKFHPASAPSWKRKTADILSAKGVHIVGRRTPLGPGKLPRHGQPRFRGLPGGAGPGNPGGDHWQPQGVDLQPDPRMGGFPGLAGMSFGKGTGRRLGAIHGRRGHLTGGF